MKYIVLSSFDQDIPLGIVTDSNIRCRVPSGSSLKRAPSGLGSGSVLSTARHVSTNVAALHLSRPRLQAMLWKKVLKFLPGIIHEAQPVPAAAVDSTIVATQPMFKAPVNFLLTPYLLDVGIRLILPVKEAVSVFPTESKGFMCSYDICTGPTDELVTQFLNPFSQCVSTITIREVGDSWHESWLPASCNPKQWELQSGLLSARLTKWRNPALQEAHTTKAPRRC